MPNYSGVWSLPTQMQAEAQGNWPSPPTIPFAFFALAYDSGGTGINVINRLALSTTGNATDFGDSTATTDGRGGAASVTRGLFTVGGNTNTIEYITFGTSGNASDFGDASTNGYYMMGASNSTRAIFGQYLDANYGYVTIASTGNTTTFGTTSASQNAYSGTSVCSSTRAVFCALIKAPGASTSVPRQKYTSRIYLSYDRRTFSARLRRSCSGLSRFGVRWRQSYS